MFFFSHPKDIKNVCLWHFIHRWKGTEFTFDEHLPYCTHLQTLINFVIVQRVISLTYRWVRDPEILTDSLWTKWLSKYLILGWYPNCVLFLFTIKMSSYRKTGKLSCRVFSVHVLYQLGLNCLISLEPTLLIGFTLERFIEFVHSFNKYLWSDYHVQTLLYALRIE